MSLVPKTRIRELVVGPPKQDGDFVLYWMIGQRRVRSNFAMDRALEHARALRKPLLVFEPLRWDYPWASERIHQFVLQGMVDNEQSLEGTGIPYWPYVEPKRDAARGLIAALSRRACVVVTDETSGFFQLKMVKAVLPDMHAPLESVDSIGILPVSVPDRIFPTAHSFRRFLQKELPFHIGAAPVAPDPTRGAAPPTALRTCLGTDLLAKYPSPTPDDLLGAGLAGLGLAGPGAVAAKGGSTEAMRRLDRFVDGGPQTGLEGYGEGRNHPDQSANTELSAHLHFGHIGAHQIFQRAVSQEGWDPGRITPGGRGARTGWWNLGENLEGFLDQLITWRELGQNNSLRDRDHNRWEGLPSWARTTLLAHAGDPRPSTYTIDQLADSETHDPVWNAAQRQLAQTGYMHNYLRMLWGKNVLAWTARPERVMEVLIELNNRYALDGRDPNSYTGISWVLGRYDRAWGPERPIYGKVRYMTSENTRKKLRMREYLKRFGPSD